MSVAKCLLNGLKMELIVKRNAVPAIWESSKPNSLVANYDPREHWVTKVKNPAYYSLREDQAMGVAPQHLDKTYLAKQLNTSKSSYIEHDAPKTIRTLPFLQQGISRNEALNTKKKIIRYKLIPGTKVKHETLCYREGQISNSNDNWQNDVTEPRFFISSFHVLFY